MTIANPAQLAEMLQAAAHAHGDYSRTLGHYDSDWAMWYARYIFNNQAKSETGMLGDYGG